jgi:hypothetical protein
VPPLEGGFIAQLINQDVLVNGSLLLSSALNWKPRPMKVPFTNSCHALYVGASRRIVWCAAHVELGIHLVDDGAIKIRPSRQLSGGAAVDQIIGVKASV